MLMNINYMKTKYTIIFGSIGSWVGLQVIYCVGEAACEASAAHYAVRHLMSQINNNKAGAPQTNSKPVNNSSILPKKTIEGGWKCKKCGNTNDVTSIFCVHCGEYR